MDLDLSTVHQGACSLEQTKRSADLYQTICTCPICKERFLPDEMGGEYLDRKCPVCSSTITIDQYDEIVIEILEKRKMLRLQLEALSADMRLINHALDLTKPREILALSGLRERKAVVSAKMNAFNTEISAMNHELDTIATDRYYISEWFLRTRIKLDHRTAMTRLNIKPHYSSKGTWCFKCNNASEAGIAAELYVAELLFQHAKDPSSPLFKAQIFPNIYIPRKRNHKKASLWVQIDCLVITRSCIFVLEIKRHNRHIIIPDTSSYISIYSSKKPNVSIEYLSTLPQIDKSQFRKLGISNRESESIKQNEFHADSLKELCPMFDSKDIFRQIIYVKPKSFTSHIHGFIEGVCVDYAYYDEPHFLKTIETQCSKMSTKYSQQQIDDIAEKIIAPNCDLDHQRETLHKMISKPRNRNQRSNGKKKR